ncbi:oxygen-dependent protoporphyrinogen oxidase [Psychromicrobium silvestre]|uniref:Coproporphyrinogen III oxidase n=1 Tax=Psychromicrobium silvestre TaxID=1645614 RepID=A0A7Y9LSY6_9MICC|nr:protoporphyrinogen oxidase [Psychromicrobium silvestre]NYE95035.1 oxygen-dependent protoporphyrinogen oxidase [Psychromicrobium silvestre]
MTEEQGSTAVVIGAGMAGLVAARELAHAGVSVTVLEATTQVGGSVAAHEVGGLVLDAGADSYAKRSKAFEELARQLGLAEQLVEPNEVGAWLEYADSRGHAKHAPLPKGVLGIPLDLDAPELREILGRSGLLRAKLDVNLPKGVGVKSRSLADMVRARMGQRVVDRLLAPVVGGVYSVTPEELDPDLAIPGLRAALQEHGSLSAAVTAIKAKNSGKKSKKPGSAVGGLRGGVYQIAQALRTELDELGVVLKLETPVESLKRTGTAWHVSAAGELFEVDKVVLATEASAAVELLRELFVEAGEFATEDASSVQGRQIALLTIVVDLPELDAVPRGTGVLVAPQVPGIKAKALTHATAKWPWLADEEGPGTHVLRLSYPEQVLAEGDPELQDALRDASALLGMEIREDDVLDWDLVRWRSAVSNASLGQQERIDALREAAAKIDGLAVTGAWLAGNGLVSVISDAQTQAQSIL